VVVMSQRLVLSFDALADGVDARTFVERVVAAVPVPRIAPREDDRVVGPDAGPDAQPAPGLPAASGTGPAGKGAAAWPPQVA